MALTRRNFLVGAAGAGIGFGLGALSYQFPLATPHFGPDWSPNDETFVPSTCLLCPAHCGIRVRLIDGRPTRIDGNPLHPVSQGGLCPKGRAGLQLLYHPSRLKGPVQRVGPPGSDHFESISWDAALDRVAAALKAAGQAHGGSPIDWLVGDVSGVMGDLIAGFCEATGTTRVWADDYRDGSADVLRMCQGINAAPAFDLAGADLVLSFGAGLAEAWWALPHAARARDGETRPSPRWIQVDVRLSRSAVGANEFVPVKPGTFGTLALGLAYVIVKEGLYDADEVSRNVAGWEDWTEADGTKQAGYRTLVLRHGRPDDVAARTGVPAARITALAKAFGSARHAVAVWDQMVSWRDGGLSDALAIHALNALTGRLNRAGGLMVQSPMAKLPGAGGSGTLDLATVPLTSTNWPASGGAAANPAQVLFLYHANPVSSLPNAEAIRQALARVPMVVSFSPFFDESARYANLILPDHTYLERWQDALSPAAVPTQVWGVVRPAVKPLQNTKATGDVLLALAGRLGGSAARWARWPSVEALVQERGVALAAASRGSAFVELFRQRELREVERRGWWLPHGQSTDDFWQSILDTGGWFDPFVDVDDRAARTQRADGRVWMFPAEARQRIRKAGLGLAEGFLPIATAAAAGAAQPAAGDYPLHLVPFRVMTLASGGTPLMPWLLEHLGVLNDSAWETWVEVSPATARQQGLQSGQRVRVESGRGGFEATVSVFAGAQPGVINVPYGLHQKVEGWGEPRGANPLAAVGSAADPVTGLPDWQSSRVRLVKL